MSRIARVGTVLICVALMLGAIAAPARGGLKDVVSGIVGHSGYLKTRDGKTLVWNNHPKNAEMVTWSGDRDGEGYATGSGTLTWLRLKKGMLTGSNIPSTVGETVVVATFSGTMVHGKFEGMVTSTDGKGDVFHATFAGGTNTEDWEAGPAPSTKARRKSRARTEAVAAATPKAAPSASPRTQVKKTEKTEKIEAAKEESPPPNDALRSMMAPSTLRTTAEAEPSPEATAMSTPSPAAPSSSASSTAGVEDTAKVVAALDKQYQAAVKANDAATMDKILADDFVLTTGSGRTWTKSDLIKQAREKKITYEHQEEEEWTQKVRVYGDTAVVTAHLWVKGDEQGNPIEYKVWFSDTYKMTPTGWKYVFGQSSLPDAKAEGK